MKITHTDGIDVKEYGSFSEAIMDHSELPRHFVVDDNESVSKDTVSDNVTLLHTKTD